MHKFFMNSNDQFEDDVIRIYGKEYYHMKKVLRMNLGEQVFVNKLEDEFLCKIINYENDFVELKIIEKTKIDRELKTNIHLIQGYIKNDKMDLIMQKATELGVYKITPLITNRSVVKFNSSDKKKKRIERFSKIAKEASKQSKRNQIPIIDDILEFDDFINIASNLENSLILVPYENELTYKLADFFCENQIQNYDNIYIIIGPEGGFEKYEIAALSNIGANLISLGNRILRSETASLYTISIVQYIVGQ